MNSIYHDGHVTWRVRTEIANVDFFRCIWSPKDGSYPYNDRYFVLDGVFHYWRDAAYEEFRTIVSVPQ
jgi:hypothetical protein